MQFRRLEIPEVVEITPSRHGDERGYFSETFRHDRFSSEVADVTFVQENQSLSRSRGVLRGLHFQLAPSAQGKLVRCVAGAILDVAVDIRHGSPSFGKFVSATLTAETGNQLWVPVGFLHGFCTLTDDTLVSYKVTSYYDGAADRGVAWNDPAIGIDWPDFVDQSLMSGKDQKQPLLRDLSECFSYSGAAS